MRHLTKEVLSELLADVASPCISLYQPTHRSLPDKFQDPIRFRNLLDKLEDSLREGYPGRDVRQMLEPFQPLVGDSQFWNHQRDGMAVLSGGDRFEIFRLQRPVPELVVVAEQFHLKPLLRIVQSADMFQVLALDHQKVSMYEGNRDALDELELGDLPFTIAAAFGEKGTDPQLATGSYEDGALQPHGPHTEPTLHHGRGGRKDEIAHQAERFFRLVDREILERFSRPSGLPLVLAALPEHQAEFRRVSKNPFLLAEGVEKHPDSLSVEELRAEVWKLLEPQYLERLEGLTEAHRTAAAQGLAATSLVDVGKATAAARIGTLLVEAERVLPGRLDPETGSIQADRLADPEVDDLLDDLAEATLRRGGEVVVVPKERMPSSTGVAATFRF